MSDRKTIGARAFAVLAGCAALLLAACDGGGSGTGGESETGAAADAETSQVIARVNGEEVTVHQLNSELAQIGQTEDPIATRRLALQAIVYRTALRQSALKDELDRQPVTMVQLQAARDKVLAESYVRAQTASTPPPTVTEIDEYMLRNPLLFDRRRIYDFKRMVMAEDNYTPDYVPLFDEKPDFAELEARLEEQSIVFKTDDVRLPSAQFPVEARERLRDMSQNDNLIIRSDDNVAIMKIISWEEVPLPRGKGRELAQALLYNQAVQKRAETTREQVLSSANIDFLGEFEGLKISGADVAGAETTETPQGNETSASPDADTGETAEGQ